MISVRELMTPAPQRCRADDSLNVAAKIMREHDRGCVLVVDCSDRVVGILTDRDVCLAARERGCALTDITAGSACTRDVTSCNPSDGIDHVLDLMAEHRVSRVPVVDGLGRPVGLLSLSDVAQHAHYTTAACGSRANAPMLAAVIKAFARAFEVKRRAHASCATARTDEPAQPRA